MTSIRFTEAHSSLCRALSAFHQGYQWLIEEGLRRVGQVCVAVRDTHGIDAKNPLSFFTVKQRIEAALSAYTGRVVVVALPNITNVFYGRDVGSRVERIVLDRDVEEISATNARRLASHPAGPGTVRRWRCRIHMDYTFKKVLRKFLPNKSVLRFAYLKETCNSHENDFR